MEKFYNLGTWSNIDHDSSPWSTYCSGGIKMKTVSKSQSQACLFVTIIGLFNDVYENCLKYWI